MTQNPSELPLCLMSGIRLIKVPSWKRTHFVGSDKLRDDAGTEMDERYNMKALAKKTSYFLDESDESENGVLAYTRAL